MNGKLTRRVEEASLNAWPAHQTLVDSGWLLRFAGGYTRRANSVNPIYTTEHPVTPDALVGKIRRCEELYHRRGLASIFKITPLVQPPHLDDVLAELGYIKEAPTGVRVCLMEPVPNPVDLHEGIKATCETALSDAWLWHFAEFSNLADPAVSALRGILHNITTRVCFTTLYDGDEPVACGLGVVEGLLLGLFDIVTAAQVRGKGHGTQLLQVLLAWARHNGAEMAYLQVMDDNVPARRLYDKLGFGEIYKYWYRVKAIC